MTIVQFIKNVGETIKSSVDIEDWKKIVRGMSTNVAQMSEILCAHATRFDEYNTRIKTLEHDNGKLMEICTLLVLAHPDIEDMFAESSTGYDESEDDAYVEATGRRGPNGRLLN